MAGLFENIRSGFQRIVREDNSGPDSEAYTTTSPPASVATPNTEQITPEGTQSNILTIQSIPQGFGAYLDGILPSDIAKAAGAFSASMQQIKNISSIPIEKFAQVVSNLETTKGLNINGTTVPTDTELAQQASDLIALGNGPYNTYTMSNFLGCMSGLPYLGLNITALIQQLQTNVLSEIYKNIYLAVNWEQATAVFDGSTFTYTNRGGGYGRESAPPTVTVDGNPAIANIGTDPNDITTFGKIISIGYTGSAGTVVIDPPPGPGYPSMNSIIQNYIDDANAEILLIKNTYPAKAQELITVWEKTGTFLSIEQRAIATALPSSIPNSSPDHELVPGLASYPTTQYAFVDSIPRYAMFTQPHMYSQTLEAISDFNTVGGRSLVGMLRQSRNQARLQEIGVPLDNNIENTLTPSEQAQLIANGTIPDIYVNGVLAGGVPATLETTLGSPDAYGYYNPIDNNYYNTNSDYQGNGEAIDTGQADEPGSFAGSRYQNLISPELSVIYASDVLLPSTYPIQEAIDEVIRCNCDCWDNI